jgi:hypothetical protein
MIVFSTLVCTIEIIEETLDHSQNIGPRIRYEKNVPHAVEHLEKIEILNI